MKQEISIIGGCGSDRQFSGENTDGEGIFAAAYNLPGDNIVFENLKAYRGGLEMELIEKCIWGRSVVQFLNCDVALSDWFTHNDGLGDALIPER